MPLVVGTAGGATLELARSRARRAVQAMFGRIRKFAANTIVCADEVDRLGFWRFFSLPEALARTVASEFGRRRLMTATGGPETRRSDADLRILYVINHLDWFWSHRLPLARAASASGFEVVVAAPGATLDERLAREGFRAAELAVSGRERPLRSVLENVRHVRRLLAAEQPAILHAVTLKVALPAALAARWFGRRTIVVATVAGLGYIVSSRSLNARIGRRILMPLLRHAFDTPRAWLIFQNSFDHALLARAGAARPGRAVIIPGSGVELRTFDRQPEPVQGPPMVLMASRLVHDKGIAVFIEAARLLFERGHVARFVLAGGIDATNPNAITAAEMKTLTADGVVEWRGHVGDMRQLYADCAVFVYPSHYGEGIPKVLLEAAASGRPIVTTDHPGCRDVVADGVNGYLVRVRDAAAVADAVATLLGDRELRERQGLASRARAEVSFDVDLVNHLTLEIYRAALAEQAAASASAAATARKIS